MDITLTAATLLRELAAAGVALTLMDGDTIKASGNPAGIDRHREQIKANKPALLAYLKQQHQRVGPRPVADMTAAVATAAALKQPLLDRSLSPTHRTTAPLLFHQPGRGPFLIGAGELVHVFPSLFAAKAAGLPADVWDGLGEWAAQKNVEKGYRLVWIEGDLRGVHPDHLEELGQ
ncbi:hypothetical protein NH8B_0504 [Pseudogulbenkiania sp. NH8B]|uniref:hypothetical protein n=1 Tax=Pseudogulbenkiania sp. (strain NH8B) TaxID=748280 RepID=UPI000227946B|nr:hypothetical protein [Pseudogulbenkiania sp. NH8B]BAK75339.1 hypothetical protein NH8B_0504 [Pseudogulbenkiania sp. NH8B]